MKLFEFFSESDVFPEITQSKKQEIISNWEYQEGLIDIGNGYQILSGENQEGYQDNDALLIDPNHNIVDNHTDIEKLLDNNFGIVQEEDVVDGNFPTQQRDREMQQGIERELKMYKILERLAQMWWNNDMSPAVEQKLADMGWEVGEDEGSDTPSVFVIEIGDENGNSYISWPIEQLENDVVENFADGKKKGKSRPGRVKRSGASCNGSVTALRKRAKNSSGEKAKMYHWCANMKSGKKKTNEDMDSLTPSAKMADDYIKDEIKAGKIKNLDELKKYILELRLSRVIEYAEDARALWVHHFTNNPHKLPNAVKEGNAFVGKIKRQFTNLELPTWMSHTSLEKLFAQDFGPRYGDYVAHMDLDSDDDLAMSNQGMGDMAFEMVKANDIKVMQKFLAQMPVQFTVDDLKLDDGVQVWHLVQQKKTVH